MKNTFRILLTLCITFSIFSFQCEVVKEEDSVTTSKNKNSEKKNTDSKNVQSESPASKEKDEKEEDFQKMRISFYNVENLFDTINEPVKLDDEFTPESEKRWDTERYNDKLGKLSRVFASMGDGVNAPTIIGLAEVENKTAINDLLKTDAFKNNSYGVVHQESPDMRGIDLALLYRKDKLKIQNQEFIEATFPAEAEYTSRDIIYTEAKVAGEKLHIFINHWPSRYGGQEKSEPRRLRVAEIVRAKIDIIQKKSSDAKIILLGDFNDGPTNKSITQILKADTVYSNLDKTHLYNVSYPIEAGGSGSYNYRGNWQLMDQVIVSQSLITDKKRMHTSNDMVKVLREDYMLYKDKRYGPKPNRSYGGPKYYGGYSDHLPIYADLILPK